MVRPIKGNEMKYRLGSSPMLHAPGLIAWAINGAKFANDRAHMIKVVRETWKLHPDVAEKLVTGAVPYIIDGETVEFCA